MEESLQVINDLRASRGLAAIAGSLLDLDPYRTLDVRIVKALPLTNHVNFRPPLENPSNIGASINSSTFLVRTAARDARQIQWGLRYVF